MPAATVDDFRYTGEKELLEQIQSDTDLSKQFQRIEVLRSRSLLRSQLLSSAVRIKPSYLPELCLIVDRVSRFFKDDKPVEAYVFGSHDINGFIADLARHRVIGISSGALTTLTSAEVAFVIGHEMGHVVFGHTELCANAVLEIGDLSAGQSRLLRSWQRACEISADRAGLAFCDSLDVAANALFKTLARLSLPNIQIDPHEFAEQWGSLAEELMEHGGREFWQLEHPFPPLRMKAMEVFWRHGKTSDGDAEIARLLGIMEDTTSVSPGRVADPVLARFQFWGGLYVILADGQPNPQELEHLRQNLPVGVQLEQVLASCSGGDDCLERFREARRTRKVKLSAGELHKIIHGLVAAARVDGELNQLEREHLYRLGGELGLRAEAIDLIQSKAEER